VVITSGFQPDERGPIPLSRSTKTKLNIKIEIITFYNRMASNKVSKLEEEFLVSDENNQGQSSNDSVSEIDNNFVVDNSSMQIEAELQMMKLEMEDWKEKATRFSADIQNLSRQHELDIQQAKKSSKKAVLMSLVGFLNTINLAFSFAPNTEDEKVINFIFTLKTSFEMAIDDFKSLGVEILIPSVGEVFNAEYMNILNPDNVSETEQVVVKQVVSCGLKIDNQLVQPVNIMI
jgi:molecular chaperone GrpE